jgi:hypothetical protein
MKRTSTVKQGNIHTAIFTNLLMAIPILHRRIFQKSRNFRFKFLRLFPWNNVQMDSIHRHYQYSYNAHTYLIKTTSKLHQKTIIGEKNNSEKSKKISRFGKYNNFSGIFDIFLFSSSILSKFLFFLHYPLKFTNLNHTFSIYFTKFKKNHLFTFLKLF